MLTLILLLTFASPSAAPKIHTGGDGPIRTKWDRDKLVRLGVTNTDAESGILWDVVPVGHAGQVDWAVQDAADVVFCGPPGRYTATVIVVSAKKGGGFTIQRDRLEFEVAGGGPPVPPVPPVPPKPDDPLRLKLRAAFDADPGDPSAKDNARRDLVALYQQAAVLARDPAVTTTAALADRVRAAGQIVAPGQLTGLRRAVGAEVGAVFPADVPLTDDLRAQAAALFTKLADAINW